MTMYNDGIPIEDHWINARSFWRYVNLSPMSVYVKDNKIVKASWWRKIFLNSKMFGGENHLKKLKNAFVDSMVHINTSEEKNEEYDLLRQQLNTLFQYTRSKSYLIRTICWHLTKNDEEQIRKNVTTIARWSFDKVQYPKGDAINPLRFYWGDKKRIFPPIFGTADGKQYSQTSLQLQSVYEVDNVRKMKKGGYAYKIALSNLLQKIPFYYVLPLIRKLVTPYFSETERKDPKEIYAKSSMKQPFSGAIEEGCLRVTFVGETFCLIQYKFRGKKLNILTDPAAGSHPKRKIDYIPMEKLPPIDCVAISNPKRLDLPTLKQLACHQPLFLVPHSDKDQSEYLQDAIFKLGFKGGNSPQVHECRWEEEIFISTKTNETENEKLVIIPLYAKNLVGRHLHGRKKKDDFNLSLPLTFAFGLPYRITERYQKRPFVHFVGDSGELPPQMQERIQKVFEKHHVVVSLQGAGPMGGGWNKANHQTYLETILLHLRGNSPTFAINRGARKKTPKDTFSSGLHKTIEEVRSLLREKKEMLSNDTFHKTMKTKIDSADIDEVIRIGAGKELSNSDNDKQVWTTEDIDKALNFYDDKMQSFLIPQIFESKEMRIINPEEKVIHALQQISEGTYVELSQIEDVANKVIDLLTQKKSSEPPEKTGVETASEKPSPTNEKRKELAKLAYDKMVCEIVGEKDFSFLDKVSKIISKVPPVIY